MPGRGLFTTPEGSSAPLGALAVFAPFASDSSKLGRIFWAQKNPKRVLGAFEQLDLCRILLVLKPRPMKRLVAMMMCAVSLGATAQIDWDFPYNPDGNNDGYIFSEDLLDLLVLLSYFTSFLVNFFPILPIRIIRFKF